MFHNSPSLQHTSFITSLQGIRDVVSEIPYRDSIFMVASLDVDALAAFHILSSLYRSDRFFGNYAAVLVSNHQDITRNIENNSDKTIFFLINCGGQYKDFNKYKDKHFFVLDACRPFYLCNVFSTLQQVRNVHLIVDKDEENHGRYLFVKKSFVDEIIQGTEDAGEAYHSSSFFDKSASELVEKITLNPDEALNEDNFIEDDDDLNADKEMADFIVHDEEEEEEDDDDEVQSNPSDGEGYNSDMAMDNESILSEIDEHYYASTREERVILYNNSDGFSKPSAFLLYSFLEQHSISLSMRWAAIISVTFHYLFDRLSDNEYPDYYSKLSYDLVYRSNEKSFDGISIPLDGDYIRNKYNDLNIELLRQWTIYDACLNSTLVARAFNTWLNSGIEAMKLFIADLGIKLQDATSPWQALPGATKDRFLEAVKKEKNKYHLSSIVFNSFERVYEQAFSLTASDQVFALLGMMQIVPPQNLLTTISNSIINAKENKQLIEQGITKAKQMRQAMNDIFKMVMENKSYTHTREFIAIDLTSINLSHFNIAFSSQLDQQHWNITSTTSINSETETSISPVAFFQLTQHFMKLVKYNKLFGKVHVILIKQLGNQVYICGLHQNHQKIRTFNRAFEFACRTYNEPTKYSNFGSQVKIIDKSKRSDIISVLLGSLVQSKKMPSRSKPSHHEFEDDQFEEEEDDALMFPKIHEIIARNYARKITKKETSSTEASIDSLLAEYEQRSKHYEAEVVEKKPKKKVKKVSKTVVEEQPVEDNNIVELPSELQQQDTSDEIPLVREAEEFKDRYPEDTIKLLTAEEANRLLTINEVCELMDKHFGLDLLVMNLSEKCSFAEYLVFVTGSSYRHMKTLAKSVVDALYERRLHKLKPKIEGEMDTNWMVVDAGNIIVQVFSPEGRRSYDLERKWAFTTKAEFEPTLEQLSSIFEKETKKKKKK
ncbi:hypothetical protein C9374_002314 [Naegleria lovaniensis]|uniref:Ribosomal silencing factor RsfS n=1 Tax=Naegleria lovaniensis TaxID=51637 RepID=A0AA88GPJ6_NAELO|nr:uncharacterized protein C9374_002314 [Naegleria lovaniensis]KAG2386570.1 hypothetical protein C9374_002314 [Naegleria lovaniensis]